MDNLIFDQQKHAKYTKLIGNVSFQHNGSRMRCDSAYQYKNNKMTAFGHVTINQGDTMRISGNTLYYDGDKGKADMQGNIVLQEKEMRLTTNLLQYDLNKHLAFYPEKGIIQDKENTLTSEKGSYHSKEKMFYFKGNVEVTNTDYTIRTENMHYHATKKISYFFGPTIITSSSSNIYCENGWYNSYKNTAQFQKNAKIIHKDYTLKGDSIFYDREAGYGKAIKNISLIDTVNRFFITGEMGEYFEQAKKTMVTKDALLNVLVENDTLFVHADTLQSNYIENNKIVKAFHHVKCFKSDLQAKCDSLTYFLQDSVIQLFYQPVIWSDTYQITSDSISIILRNGKLDKMYLSNNPLIISKEDELHFNQIQGKKMVGLFKNNKLKTMQVIGNGQSVFIAKEEDETIGINTSKCTNISLNFNDNKLNGITFHTQPEALMHPIEKIEEKEKFLNGFHWRGAERPYKKIDIFD